MSEVRIQEHIEAPPEEVFARVTDFAHAGEFIEAVSRVEMLSEGPVGVGTRFRETRKMFGREATEVMEVTEFEAPRRYVLQAESHGTRYRSEFLLEPRNGGTDVTMTFGATPLSLVAKIMSVFSKPMMKSVASACAKDLEDVKAAVEGARRGA